jgi:glycine/D-amino acid oxidase-like deaminating enzyme
MTNIPERSSSSPGRMPSDIDGDCSRVACADCGHSDYSDRMHSENGRVVCGGCVQWVAADDEPEQVEIEDAILDVRKAVAAALRELYVPADHKQIVDRVVDRLPEYFRGTLVVKE